MIGGSHPTPTRFPIASEPAGSNRVGEFILTLWTDDPGLAREADIAGIQRVGLDLETLGKRERQRGLGTWISGHRLERLPEIGSALHRAQLFARTNPLHGGTAAEVGRLIEHGADVLMLPMFRHRDEVACFTEIVAGRAAVIPLLETHEAAGQISRILAIDGIDEIHIGINDLAISLGVRTRFEVLMSPLMQRVADCVREAGTRLGVGAIGRVGDTTLPIPSDLLYARFVGLGATAALLARRFLAGMTNAAQLQAEVARSRERLEWWRVAGEREHRRAERGLRLALADCQSW